MTSLDSGAAAIELRGISKQYGSARVLDSVSFSVRPGEIVGLVGANGAGKSTLARIIAGTAEADAGTVMVAGREVERGRVTAMNDAGVAVVYQDEQLVPALSVLDNLCLGENRGVFGLSAVPRRARRADLERRLSAFGLTLNLSARVNDLRPAQRKEVEIARGLLSDAKVLLLDEPTAALSPHEVGNLLSTLRTLRERDVAIIIVSHILEEILSIADRVVVLRNGRNVAIEQARDLDQKQLTMLMFGHELATPAAIEAKVGEWSVLEVRGLATRRGRVGVDFDLRAGEVCVLTGLLGSGRTSLLRAIAGTGRAYAGTIVAMPQGRRITSRRVALKAGIGVVPEDRIKDGIITGRSVRENLAISSLRRRARAGFVRRRLEDEMIREQIGALSISPPSGAVEANNLSGGNQQKVVIGRWLAADARILLMDEPTAGVDVRTKDEVYRLVRRLAGEGAGIMVSSSDIDEVLALADRVVVVRAGSIVADVRRQAIDRAYLVRAMSGEQLTND